MGTIDLKLIGILYGVANLPNCSAYAVVQLCKKLAVNIPCYKCVNMVIPCYKCVNMVMPPCFRCIHKIIYERDWEWGINPLSKEQLTEEIIQEVLQRPELSRAMKNMFKKIQEEK